MSLSSLLARARGLLTGAGAQLGTGRAARLLVELGATTLLMRWLGPAPFGLVAMSTALMAGFAAIGDAGAGASLVSDRGDLPRRTAAATLVALGLAVVTFCAAVACTPLVVRFYDDARLGPVWMLTAVSLAVVPLGSVPQALAQRAERFGWIAWAPVVSALVGGGVALALARAGAEHLALVARLVIAGCLTVFLLWWVVRPRLARPHRDDLREVVRFSRGVVGFDLLNVVARNADNLVVGRALGSHALGLYSLGYRVLTLPLSQLGSIARTLAYPRLAKRLPDLEQVARGLGQSTRQLAWLTTPLSLGIAVAAEDLILVLFGPAWLGALHPFRILSLLAVVQAPLGQMHLAYTVSRRTEAMARWGLVSTPVVVASFFVGLPWGITGVAASYAIASVLLAGFSLRNAARALQVPTRALAGPIVRGLLEGALAATPLIVTFGLLHVLGAPAVSRLGGVIAVGAATELWLLHRLRRAVAGSASSSG